MAVGVGMGVRVRAAKSSCIICYVVHSLRIYSWSGSGSGGESVLAS